MDDFLSAEEDECQPNPCLNGGRCMAHFFGGGFDCECPLGYRGTTCAGRLQIYKEMEHQISNQLIFCALLKPQRYCVFACIDISHDISIRSGCLVSHSILKGRDFKNSVQ